MKEWQMQRKEMREREEGGKREREIERERDRERERERKRVRTCTHVGHVCVWERETVELFDAGCLQALDTASDDKWPWLHRNNALQFYCAKPDTWVRCAASCRYFFKITVSLKSSVSILYQRSIDLDLRFPVWPEGSFTFCPPAGCRLLRWIKRKLFRVAGLQLGPFAMQQL